MISKEPLPPLHRLLHRRPRKPDLPLPPDLPLRTRNPFLLNILHGDKHFLRTDQIPRQIFLETARDEGARGVAPGEEIVAPAGPVDGRVGRDVEDGAVDGEVDGEGGVGAIVEGEFGGGEVNGTGLEDCSVSILLSWLVVALGSGLRPRQVQDGGEGPVPGRFSRRATE